MLVWLAVMIGCASYSDGECYQYRAISCMACYQLHGMLSIAHSNRAIGSAFMHRRIFDHNHDTTTHSTSHRRLGA